nr:MAG TPA: hypothetical protein [Caudoviricetes sp.]
MYVHHTYKLIFKCLFNISQSKTLLIPIANVIRRFTCR